MTSPRVDCPGDAGLLELLIADDSTPGADGLDIARTGSDVTSAGLALAKARCACRELTESTFFAADPGVGASSARSGNTRREATAIVANIRATNFIVGS